jgi:uncharacterized protein YbaA (DUF1428 family)
MNRYVDGFVLAVPRRNVAQYRRIATIAGRVWRKYGALQFRECQGDDLNVKGMGVQFPGVIKARRNETVFFSYIVFKSRAHRDRVNKKVMKDPKIAASMKDIPFDIKP